ncbi:hypothetical protein J2736_006678 [Paenibacillus qinlingensis]|uniref:Uncharacterized protein n=1 Tax=Paenibacillus qinlingensis TaxID=1837343 RepID=A0ABU1P6P9_9BACL|nr:hypothetical protein [Paenibacillus qinlingensis]
MMGTYVKFKFSDTEYEFTNDLEFHGDYIWTEGNFSCDCNRSSFIQEHCDSEFPLMDCGDTIELIEVKEALT